MNINDIDLVQTCMACPEQYDAYYGDEYIGYLRLRHGHFTVEYKEVCGELLYEADTIGDELFADKERDEHLLKAKEAIVERYNNDHRSSNS